MVARIIHSPVWEHQVGGKDQKVNAGHMIEMRVVKLSSCMVKVVRNTSTSSSSLDTMEGIEKLYKSFCEIIQKSNANCVFSSFIH